ncbi:MAG: 30S ribosome-binding factor RbfA [Candidatus Izimaplasma sp.]|nr:30S ribosome-binding factor RbfA [Candidatus Izimaplasma bacterium]
MSNKIEHLQTTIQRTLSEIYRREVKDDNLGFLTITAVDLTKDLSYLTIYYTILGDDTTKEESYQALLRSRKFVKTLMAQRVKIRKVPEFRFKYDKSLDRGNRITEGLKEVLPEDE